MSDATFILPEQLRMVSRRMEQPYVLIELKGDAPCDGQAVLPPVPVIGVGDFDHPAARWMDAVVADRERAEPLVNAIEAHPQTARVLVQVLRLSERLTAEDALTAESMAYGLLQAGQEHKEWLQPRSGRAAGAAGNVQVERVNGDLHVLMNRPAADNAIDRTMRDALCEAFELAGLDTSIDRIELRSVGKAFSVGADLTEFGTTSDAATAHDIRMQTLPARSIARCHDRLHVHVQGACIGAGLEMAAFARHITASPKAWFQLPELAMGVIPGAGGCVSVPRRIGRRRAAWMMLTGKRVSAKTALEWGLVDAIVDD